MIKRPKVKATETDEPVEVKPKLLNSEIKLAVAGKSYPGDWHEQVEQVAIGLRSNQIDLGGERNAAGIVNRLTELQEIDNTIGDMEGRLATVRDIRTEKRVELWQLASGLRRAIAGLFGPDSLEYKALGGIRTSERKRPKRKSKTEPKEEPKSESKEEPKEEPKE